MSSKQSTNCDVCMEDFTSSVRARVNCPHCDIDVCRACVRLYLMKTTQQAHCMGPDCKCTWDRQFLIDNTLRSFVNGEYKTHRAKMLFEKEKARMPETMSAVENYRNVGKLQKKVSEDAKELDIICAKYQALKNQIQLDKKKIKQYKNGDETGEKRVFKQKCGVEGCLGFLSSAWKCGLCDTWTCPKCFDILGVEKECGHECDPNNVESAKMIKKETRNCPSCATAIFKIEGCDQMWCTQCHIAFSWKSGMRVNGVVHNPHFYQWQRTGGGTAPIQTPGAQACGGMPGSWQFRRQLNRKITGDPYKPTDATNRVMKLHAGCNHFQHWELNRLRRDCQGLDQHKELRIKFLCKEITETKFMQKIQQCDKKREKKMAQLQVCELMNTVFLENLNDIQQLILQDNVSIETVIATCNTNLERCHKVRVYGNKQLIKISGIYSQNVGLLNTDFRSCSKKIKDEIVDQDRAEFL